MLKNMANIVLVGMMGSGKSTLSHLLYEKTGYQPLDCDLLIETQEGMTISDMFKLHGQEYFRDKETELLSNLSPEKAIISTGGGMILRPINRERLSSFGTVFYLEGSLDTLYNRLINQTDNRPLLDVKALYDQLSDLLLKRGAIYRQAADYSICIDNKTPDQIVTEIYAILSELDYKFLT